MINFQNINLIYPFLSLIVFALLTPLIDYLGRKIKFKYLSGVWATLGFIAAIYFIYKDYLIVQVTGKQFYTVFFADMLTIYVSTLFLGMGLIATFYSIRYMEHDTGLTTYYTLVQTMIAGMVGVTFSGDLFTLFIFWEMMSISSYVLVAFRKEEMEPVEAALKYFVMSSSGSATYLFSIALIYGLTGTLNLQYLTKLAFSGSPPPLFYLSLGMMIVAFGIKASIVPFHTWLPDAHPAAPSPISALLSGVVIKTGIYALLRVFFTVFKPEVFNYGMILVVLSILTMTIGNLTALLQKDIKRLLACSTVTQVGFILIGVSAAVYSKNAQTALFGLTSSLFHILNHAVMKGLAFLAAGVIIHQFHTRDINQLSGTGRVSPLIGVSLSISLLALGGVPPLNGFMSKWMLFTSAIEAGLPLLAAIGMLNSAFSIGYYLWLIQRIMIGKPEKTVKNRNSIIVTLPIIVLTILCIVIGLFPETPVKLAETAASALTNLG